MVNFISYFILIEGVTILVIKIDGLLNIPQNLDSVIVLDAMPLSLGRKYLGHTNELLGIIG